MYKYDIHTHTSEVSPCGRVNASEVVKLYKQAGYKGIVITDHYYKGFFDKIDLPNWKDRLAQYLKGYRIAYNEGIQLGLTVILGIELRFIDGPSDYLIYGIDEKFLLENPELYNLDLKKFRKMIEGKGMLIYQAHPFRDGFTVPGLELLDGIEIYNGNQKQNSKNDIAHSFAINNKLKMVSGSDFHIVQDLAKGGVILKEEVSTPKELADALRDNKIIQLIINGNYSS
ncbi:MAG TPA: PHP domain-containing protein [Clostridiales bacterium]|nr:PHP domain-containing protein [Clostridiales bacterium]